MPIFYVGMAVRVYSHHILLLLLLYLILLFATCYTFDHEISSTVHEICVRVLLIFVGTILVLSKLLVNLNTVLSNYSKLPAVTSVPSVSPSHPDIPTLFPTTIPTFSSVPTQPVVLLKIKPIPSSFSTKNATFVSRPQAPPPNSVHS